MVPLWAFYALLSALSAGCVAILGKKGLANLDSTFATTLRTLIMAVFLVALSAILGKFKHIAHLSSTGLFFITLSGIAGALSWLCYFLALQLASIHQVPAVTALDRLSIVFVLIFSVVFLGDALTIYSAAGALLITLGALLMALR